MGAIREPKNLTINENSSWFKLWSKWANLHGWDPYNITYRGLLSSGILVMLYSSLIGLYIKWTIFSWSSMISLGWYNMYNKAFNWLDRELELAVWYFVIHVGAFLLLIIFGLCSGLFSLHGFEEILQNKGILPKIKIIDKHQSE